MYPEIPLTEHGIVLKPLQGKCIPQSTENKDKSRKREANESAANLLHLPDTYLMKDRCRGGQ